jgi:D-cysteine desulfhydrase
MLELGALASVPTIGWLDQPSPLQPHPALAEVLGAEQLLIKRDDLLAPLFGGTKLRKLDYLLAAPRYRRASDWAAAGAVGSGLLVAATAAALELGHRLHAYMCWQPICDDVRDNLAYVATHADQLRYYASRPSLMLHAPRVLLGRDSAATAVIPPGATCARAMLGLVRAGHELAAQLEGADPDEVVVPLGTGGIAAGLSVGLAVAGVSTVLVAVAVVERPLATMWRIRRLQRELVAELRRHGVAMDVEPLPVVIDRSALGRGYGVTTEASLQACRLAEEHDVTLEPIYSGKAWASLVARRSRLANKRLLFWATARRGPLPRDPQWRNALPEALAERLDGRHGHARLRRRKLLLGGAAIATAGAWYRGSGYDVLSWEPRVLTAWQVALIRAVGEVVLAPRATEAQLDELAPRIDRYLVHLPLRTRHELTAALWTVEHGTTPLLVGWSRFTECDAEQRVRHLARLEGLGGLAQQCYRAVRELCMLGYYQQPSTWASIGYDGPRVPPRTDPGDPARMGWPTYDALIAPAAMVPKGRR